jgi:hypothetical protein
MQAQRMHAFLVFFPHLFIYPHGVIVLLVSFAFENNNVMRIYLMILCPFLNVHCFPRVISFIFM